jgi:hypothetical protein
MAFECIWNDDGTVTILEAFSDNRYAGSPPQTEDERHAAREKRNRQTGFENLRDLMKEMQDKKWQASPLYHWFEDHCPGYKVFLSHPANSMPKEAAKITFADPKHAMHFKLVWA